MACISARRTKERAIFKSADTYVFQAMYYVPFVGGCFGKYSKISDLGDAVAGDLVGFLGNSAAAAFYLLCRPGQDMPNQIFPGGSP